MTISTCDPLAAERQYSQQKYSNEGLDQALTLAQIQDGAVVAGEFYRLCWQHRDVPPVGARLPASLGVQP